MRVFIYFTHRDSLFRDILLRIYLCLSDMFHINVYFLVYFVKNLSLNGSMKWRFKCAILIYHHLGYYKVQIIILIALFYSA